MLADRKEALARYVEEAKKLASNAVTAAFEQKMVVFLQEKADANDVLYNIYQGKSGSEREQAFYEASKNAWGKGVPGVIAKLEESIRGPYALGDQVVSVGWGSLM